MKTLSSLLSPLSIDQFLSTFWTKQALHIPAEDAHKFRHVFSWQALNELLNCHHLTEPDIRLSRKGKPLPIYGDRQQWIHQIRDGATLIINGVHQRVPSVSRLAADLRHEIGHETHVNLYCSPDQQQGFDCHYDTHDVLILQIEGEKEWFVFQETLPAPVQGMDSSQQPQPQGEPYIHCLLKPGDLLYIPRGHWHYAIAAEQLSLHLTVGIEPQTGLDWLGWLIHELQQHPHWRQTLPLAIADSKAWTQQLDSLRQELIQVLQQPQDFAAFAATMRDRHQPPLPINLPTQLGINLFPEEFSTQYTWSSLHRVDLQKLTEDHYQIKIGTKRIDLKAVPAGLLENMTSRGHFSLSELADWHPELDFELDVVPLITQLIQVGILQIA
jgi:ribosomal protein L16 Arg81 hydroxylase